MECAGRGGGGSWGKGRESAINPITVTATEFLPGFTKFYWGSAEFNGPLPPPKENQPEFGK